MSAREVILGVGGGIAAYKSADLLRRLQDEGFAVTVVPTPSSLNFVGAATWEALSGRPVTTNVWERVSEVRHVLLGKEADFILIAPATADLIARIAHGRADDLLTNTVLASHAPIVVVPAMHPAMWTNPATQENVALLRSRGVTVIEPDIGRLTGNDSGVGRFPEVARIVKEFKAVADRKNDLTGLRVLVTAGGTREAIDPIRFIGNRSSGKQGYAIAKAALARGASVDLILANSNLADLPGAQTIRIESAAELHDEVSKLFPQCHILAMSAAVADAKPENQSQSKIKKVDFNSILLTANPDILATIAQVKKKQIVIAFAAETSLDLAEGRRKLFAKSADILFLNDVLHNEIFASDMTQGVLFIGGSEESEVRHDEITQISKDTLADLLLDHALVKLG